jgi:ABC-type transport system substrate-binding protein
VVVEKNYEITAFGVLSVETMLSVGFRPWDSRVPTNYNGYSNPEYDAAMDMIREAADIDAYQEGLEALQTVINEDVPFVPWAGNIETTVWNPRIHGIQWHTSAPLLDRTYLED